MEYTLWFDRFKESYSDRLTITLNNERKVVTLKLKQKTKQEKTEENDLHLLTSFNELSQFIQVPLFRTNLMKLVVAKFLVV